MLTRRAALALLPSAAVLPRALLAGSPRADRVWIGTGTDKTGSQGIYIADWSPDSGRLGEPSLDYKMASPTFMARSPQGSFVYALSEVSDGKVTALRATPNGAFELVNQQSTQGAGPAHVALHPSGASVFVANYGGGSLTSYAVLPGSGALSAPVSHFSYGDAARPSHAHCVTPTPDGRWLLVNDLGLDRILVYRVDGASGRLTANDPPFWQARAGSGPRHLAFHPNGRWVYNVNELDSTIDVLTWDREQGRLSSQGFVSTLPPDWPPHIAFAAEVLVSPDGRFVYASNRRNETIAALSVNPANGLLTLVQLQPHGGRTARHIALSPNGHLLLVAAQDSGTIVVFSRNPETGLLSLPLQTVPIASPQCLIFARPS